MKELGMAGNEAEHLLEAAIVRVGAWNGQIRYRPVSGGISNTNFRIEVAGASHDFFVKIPGRGTEMFIDRKAARAASRQAEMIGVGPKTFDYLDHEGIEIAEFVADRRPSTHADFVDPAVRAETVRLYRLFHQAPRLPLTKTVFDMIDEHDDQVRQLGGFLPEDHDWLTWQYRQARAALKAAGLDLGPCFNDPMPGNFLLGADKSIMLIDFEYASNNDRLYDLAIWAGEHFFS